MSRHNAHPIGELLVGQRRVQVATVVLDGERRTVRLRITGDSSVAMGQGTLRELLRLLRDGAAQAWGDEPDDEPEPVVTRARTAAPAPVRRPGVPRGRVMP